VPEVQVNGVSLYYEEHGAGEASLGVHGGGSSAAFWSDAAGQLATLGRVIVYDRRGHFRSERPDPYITDVHRNADDAAALIEALAAAPAIVIGRSYGGAVAVDVALRHPDLVRALVLLEGDVPSMSETAAREWAALEQHLTAAAEGGPDVVAEALVEFVFGEQGWKDLPAAAREIFEGNAPAILAELRGGYPTVSPEQLGAIERPALLVGAKDSLLDYTETIERVSAALPSARVEWVAGGHAIDPAHPVVLAFISEVLAATR
jgi:esterase